MKESQSIGKCNSVVVYSQNEELLRFVAEACRKLEVAMTPAKSYIDLIAIPCFMVFIDSRLFFSLPKSDIKDVAEVLRFEETANLKIIFTEDNEGISSYFIKSQYRILSAIDSKNIELLILEQYKKYIRHRKKEKAQESIIARRMLILFEGLKGKPIRKQSMAKEFSVSERTILRDIEFLRGLGELLEYDASSKAYWLTMSSFKDMFGSHSERFSLYSKE